MKSCLDMRGKFKDLEIVKVNTVFCLINMTVETLLAFLCRFIEMGDKCGEFLVCLKFLTSIIF